MEEKNTKENGNFNLSKVVRQIALAVILLVIFIALIAGGQIIFILQIFGWIESVVRTSTGMDILFAKAVSAMVLAVLLFLPIWGLSLSFLPIPIKHKRGKRAIVLMIFALIFFALAFSSKNVFFDPKSGQPMKYYSMTPDGEYKLYSSAGYDPVTGDKLSPITKEVALAYLGGVNKKVIEKKASSLKEVVVKENKDSLNADNFSKEVLLQNNTSLTNVMKIKDEPPRVKKEPVKTETKLSSQPPVLKEEANLLADDSSKNNVVETKDVAVASVVEVIEQPKEEKKKNLRLYAKDTLGIKSVYEYCAIEFKNSLKERIFLCISAEPMLRDSFEVFLMQPGDKLTIELFEGNHYFMACNMLGKAIYNIKSYQIDKKPVYLAGEKFYIEHFCSLVVRPNKNRNVIINDNYMWPTIF